MKFHKLSVFLFTAVLFFISGCGSSYVLKRTNPSADAETKQSGQLHSEDINIKPPDKKLILGEKLTYEVKWLNLPVGIITATVSEDLKDINGNKAYEVEVKVKTNAFCSAIYRIEDTYTSYIDINTLATLRHIVNRNEAHYKKHAITDFDQNTHTAYFKNFLDKSEKTFKIPENAQDTLSACYYFRMLDCAIGDKIEYNVVNNEQNYQLYGIVEDKRFIKIHGLGNYESFFIQPYAREIGGEQVKKGKVSGYFSADEKRLPLLAIVEAPMFTKVTATLVKIENN